MDKQVFGTVRWFDSLKGEGLIRLETGESIMIERSVVLPRAIRFELSRRASAFMERHVYAGQQVVVRVHRDSHWKQIDWFRPYQAAEAARYLAETERGAA